MDNHFQRGTLAIQPHLPTIPAFTDEDVRDYVARHSASGGSISSVKTPTVIKIEFMTTQ